MWRPNPFCTHLSYARIGKPNFFCSVDTQVHVYVFTISTFHPMPLSYATCQFSKTRSYLKTRGTLLNTQTESKPPDEVGWLYKTTNPNRQKQHGMMSPLHRFNASPPPWQVLDLLASHLDPKTLAISSCVSKSWHNAMRSDHVWQPICTTQYPSLANLKVTYPHIPYNHLYGIAYVAAKCCVKHPTKPLFSLHNLIFVVSLRTKNDSIVNIARLGSELDQGLYKGVFRFDVGVNYEHSLMTDEASLEDIKICWLVVLEGWGAIFTMMDCEGKMRFAPGAEGWFSEELPSQCCCSSDAMSGIVADLKLGFCSRNESGGRVRVDAVSIGMLSIVNWRYVSIDDGLRYLQNFLVEYN